MLLERGFYSPIIEVIADLYGTKFKYKSPYKGEVFNVDLTWLNHFTNDALKHVFTAIAKLAQKLPYGHDSGLFISANTMLVDRRVDTDKLSLVLDAFIRSLVECQNVQRELKARAYQDNRALIQGLLSKYLILIGCLDKSFTSSQITVFILVLRSFIMFDLGVMRCNAVKYLKAVQNIERDLTPDQIDDLAIDLVDERGDLYDFALCFVSGLYDEYCERNNLDDLDLLCAYDDARDYLPRWFLEHFIRVYNCERDEFLEFGVLDFAFACMTGKKVSPEYEHEFSVYFWKFYCEFKNGAYAFYTDYQDILCDYIDDDDENE